MTVGTGGDHGGHEGVDAVDDAIDVDVERPTPIIHLVLPERPFRTGADAGVVAEQMDGAEPLERGIAKLLHRGEIGDVAAHPDDVESFGLELAHRLGERVVIHVGQHHLHTLAGESFAHGPTDASGTTGDDRHLAGEYLDHLSPTGDMSS